MQTTACAAGTPVLLSAGAASTTLPPAASAVVAHTPVPKGFESIAGVPPRSVFNPQTRSSMFSPCIRHAILAIAGLLLPAAAMAAADHSEPVPASNAFAPGGVAGSASPQSMDLPDTEGSVEVTLEPYAALYYGGEWYLDGDGSQIYSSGQTVTGIAPGPHTVDFAGVYEGLYTPPAPVPVDVVAGQTVSVTGTYVQTSPSDGIQVNIIPDGIGGQWRIDSGGTWPGGVAAIGLADGSYTISFTPVNGFITPPSQIVTTGSDMTTITSGTYSQIPGIGSLTVNVVPQGADNEACTWSINGGVQRRGGTTLSGLPAAPYTVKFTAPSGSNYSAPPDQTVYVIASGNTTASGMFTAVSGAGSLKVTLSPRGVAAAGNWYLTGGPNKKSGVTLTGLPFGPYTVNFTPVGGYYTPQSQNITIEPDETLAVSGVYVEAPHFVGTAQSFSGLADSGSTYLTLTMNAVGRFTGKVLTAAPSTYTVSGSLNADGVFEGNTPGAHPVSYSLLVTGTSASSYIATFTIGTDTFSAYPAVYASGARVGSGKYTLLLNGTDPSADIPQGVGYANLSFKAGGYGSASGRLGDGTPFLASGLLVNVSGTDELFLFDPSIYGGKGLLSGGLVFSTDGTQFLANMLWIKPPGRGPYYAAGFQTALNVAGDFYNITAPASFSSTLTFSGGGLPAPVVQPFSYAANGVVTVANPAFPQIGFSINAYTGVIAGAFRPVIDGVTRYIPFSAMLLKDPLNPRAGGYFIGPVLSGTGVAGGVTLP